MSDYSSYSSDSRDFLYDYSQKTSRKNLEKFQHIVSEFGEAYQRDYQLINTYLAESYTDMSFYLSNQWNLSELSYLQNQRRSTYTFNKLRKLINMVDGYQRKNRLASTIQPIEDASEYTAEILSDALQYVMQSSMGYEAISDAFKACLITGISWLTPYVDFRDDPINGDIKFAQDDWNSVMFDPFMTKRDMSDCNHLSRRKYLSKTEIKSLIPGKEEEIEALPYSTGTTDDKFTYLPYARNAGMQKLMAYSEYWKQSWETKQVLVDKQTGETQEWKGDRARLQLFRQQFPQVEVIRKPVKQIDLGIIVQGDLLWYGKDPNGLNDYPMTPMLCVWEPSYDLWEWKLQGIIRIGRDSNREVNQRRSKMSDLMDSQLNSGWIAKANSVSNQSSLFKSGQGQVVFLKEGAQIGDVQKIEPTNIAPSWFQLEELYAKDTVEDAGGTAELFGMAENDNIETAAVLSKYRQAAGLVNFQGIFDGLRQSQKIITEKVTRLIQLNYSPEKIRLITKKEPSPEFFSKNFAKYNVVCEEGILTDTQRQANFIGRVYLKQLGIDIPDSDLIKNSNLHDKQDLQKTLDQQAQQQQQVAQTVQQLEMEKLAIESKKADSEIESNKALAAERINKVGLDAALSAERIERIDEEKTAGILNLAKAVKELQGLDVDNLLKHIEALKTLKGDYDKPKEKKTP